MKRERLFVGWSRPLLLEAARILKERYARAGVWDMTSALVALPGGQAARRLRRILETVAEREGLTVVGMPEMVTPADLPERLYAPSLPMATPMAAAFAWREAASRVPGAPESLGELARKVRNAAVAECLTLADIARRLREMPDVSPDPRWETLARLEDAYRAVLAEAGLRDRNDARLAALAGGVVTHNRDVFLVGTADLNGLEREMVRSLAGSVCVLVPAPPNEAAGFDDLGVLKAEHWQEKALPIADERLHFVSGPGEEVGAIIEQLAALDGQYARDEITVGVGDESAAESLRLRIAASGLPLHSPFGRPLSRARPVALLHAIREWMREPSARRFAALVRHPDLEQWLDCLPIDNSAEPTSYLDLLDQHRAEHLPERLADTELPAALADAVSRVGNLLAAFTGPSRRLNRWAEPITELLCGIYEGVTLAGDAPEERQLRRAFRSLREILSSLGQVPDALAPNVGGAEALAFVLAQTEGQRLPTDETEAGLEMMGWLELAWDDAPVLLLTGLHEGRVPAAVGDDPLLPDSLRRRLGLADDRRRLARDSFLLRVMLESRPHVHLIVSRRGADGAPKMPSRLLFACDGLTAARRARRFADGTETKGNAPPAFAAGHDRRLPPPRPEPLPMEMRRLRVTAFRDYLACPYRFYLRHILKLDERGDAADEMDRRLFGILVHDALMAFARSRAAYLTDERTVSEALRDELARQSRKRFGPEPSPPVRLQVRQAGRRLDAFARWQAQSVRDGWQIQDDLSEREIEAALTVDGEPFVINGRLDRVDYCAATDRFRIIDYKTRDTPAEPDAKHRTAASPGGERVWTDLQLPLYRRLLEAQGIGAARIEVGYVLLSADLTPVTTTKTGRHEGGIGFAPAPWTDDDYDSAVARAEEVVRHIRRGVFWPPAEPPRFTDPYSGLCLDACTDRADWLAAEGTLP